MPVVTSALPSVGSTGYFSLKEPFAQQLKATLMINDTYIKMEVESIVSMVDYITKFKRDPFMDVYNPAGIDMIEYKQDKEDAIPIVTLKYVDSYNQHHLFKVPHNYISGMSDETSVPYINRVLNINLGMLPEDLNIEHIYDDVVDFIAERTGVNPELNDVSIGEVTLLTVSEHEGLEIARKQTTTVKQTLYARAIAAETRNAHILSKLKEKGILLS